MRRRASRTARVTGGSLTGREIVHGLELFGPDRLMWGSDWPMTLLTAGYAGTWQVMSALIGELSADEQRLLLGDTARRTYRLTAKETTPC